MPKIDPVSPEQMDVAFSGPAFLANRLFVTLGPGGVRIAFAEQYAADKPAQFRTAVNLPLQDGLALRDVLISLLKAPEEQMKKAHAQTISG